MARYGDPVVCIFPGATFFDMPTAILAASTGRGFFIAADGRVRRENDGVFDIISNYEQKIFDISDKRARFAFALTGTARFTPDDDDGDIVFDFYTAIFEAAAKQEAQECSHAGSYCMQLGQRVHRALERSVTDAQRAGKPIRYPSNQDGFPDGDGIALLLLLGHYSGVPHGAILRFYHENQKLRDVRAVKEFATVDSIVSGPGRVWQLCQVADPKFLRFRTAPNEFTFDEMAMLVKEYVAACESPRGIAADPIAEGVGGHVHAAAITSEHGFKWIPGYEPIEGPQFK